MEQLPPRKNGKPDQRFRKTGPRPERWKHGPSQEAREQLRAFTTKRCQARYRQEAWSLTFEEFQRIWSGRWHQRGRRWDSLNIARQDPLKPWSKDNVMLQARGLIFRGPRSK
jgi:hypothetical protein